MDITCKITNSNYSLDPNGDVREDATMQCITDGISGSIVLTRTNPDPRYDVGAELTVTFGDPMSLADVQARDAAAAQAQADAEAQPAKA